MLVQSMHAAPPADRETFLSRAAGLHWGLILLLTTVAAIGFLLLYSAAGGKLAPWAERQMLRYGIALVILFGTALLHIRVWIRYAYAVYAVSILLLVVVELMGETGGGATRWIDLVVIRLQPSEVVKIALVLALARYFHRLPFRDIGKPWLLIPPLFFIVLPAALVLKQPDLGTAVILLAVGGAMFFLAGVRWWKFVLVGGAVAAAIPLAWSLLHGYQRKRLFAFLDPEKDPLGSGYHIIQAKIAVGSGGFWGKGYLGGTQIHLDFLPEIHTDFIYSVLGEEFGMAGGLFLLGLYAAILVVCIGAGLRAKNQFARLICLGVAFTFFLYVFINLAMVMNLLPVVGVPLPLVSYGGTSMLTLMFGFGLVQSAYIHRHERIGRFDDEDE
jgi:rod shape determining protein RodA